MVSSSPFWRLVRSGNSLLLHFDGLGPIALLPVDAGKRVKDRGVGVAGDSIGTHCRFEGEVHVASLDGLVICDMP